MAKKSTQSSKGKTFVRPTTQREPPLNLGSAMQPAAAYQPRDVQQPEAVDYGSPANVVSGRNASRPGSAALAANLRQRLVAPTVTKARPESERAIPAGELETHGPVSLRKRLPIQFPEQGDFGAARSAMQPADPIQDYEASQFEPYDPDAGVDDGGEQGRVDDQVMQQQIDGIRPDPFAARIAQLQGSGQAQALPRGRQRSPVSLETLKVEDVDQLWDWIRSEPDRAAPFFGKTIKTALELHMTVQHWLQMQAQGIAIVRALIFQQQLLGLGMIWPINMADRIGNLHLYVAPSYRHAIGDLLPALIHEAELIAPPTMRLAVYSNRPGWAELLQPLGFVTHQVHIKER